MALPVPAMKPLSPQPIIGTSDDILPLIRWLFAVAALVFAIIVIGGITRLTESGLSITEWKPVTGTIPPLSDAAWQAEFEAYKRIPQYLEVNGPAGMTLAQYKYIYFWEWLHRVIARFIGVAFALPLVWFWLKGSIPPGYKLRLLALLALGSLQGAVGWWMVTSGLSENVTVSHFRLAAHLGVAFLTLGGLIWTALDLLQHRKGRNPAKLTGLSALVMSMLAIQILFGALVAGLRAGAVAGAGWFNADSWPLMQGSLFPEGIDWAAGKLHALLSDPFLTHFIHRWWAFAVLAVLIVMARKLRAIGRRDISILIHAVVGTQILLGIATVWSGVAIWLGVVHQGVAALLVGAVVYGAQALGSRD